MSVANKAVQIYRFARRCAQYPIPIRVSRTINPSVTFRSQQALEDGQVGKPDSQIEIRMRPRLLPQEGIHAPTAVEPKLKARTLEQSAKSSDVIQFHEGSVTSGANSPGKHRFEIAEA